MDETTQAPADQAAERRQPGPPEGKVIGAFAPSAADAVTAALEAAGFASDQIEVLTAADAGDLDALIERPGFGGALDRFLLSLGDDRDELDKARQELANGHILIGLRVVGSENIHRVRDIMRENGGHNIIHFGRWTITTFD